MQNIDIEEISAVMRDFAFALDKLRESDPNREQSALHLTKMALRLRESRDYVGQEQRHRRRFWGFLGRFF